jgi:hypothetical protein
MRWFTFGAVILGFAAGGNGCYVIPIDEIALLR